MYLGNVCVFFVVLAFAICAFGMKKKEKKLTVGDDTKALLHGQFIYLRKNAGADPGRGLWGLKTPHSGPACSFTCISMYNSVD